MNQNINVNNMVDILKSIEIINLNVKILASKIEQIIINKVSKTDLNKLHQEDDSDIDYSDIPETNEEFWKDAEVMK